MICRLRSFRVRVRGREDINKNRRHSLRLSSFVLWGLVDETGKSIGFNFSEPVRSSVKSLNPKTFGRGHSKLVILPRIYDLVRCVSREWNRTDVCVFHSIRVLTRAVRRKSYVFERARRSTTFSTTRLIININAFFPSYFRRTRLWFFPFVNNTTLRKQLYR